jgi:hypothetical protein
VSYKAYAGWPILPPSCFKKEVAFMIDALFWYTGLTAWILIALGSLSLLVAEAHDRSVLKRDRH